MQIEELITAMSKRPGMYLPMTTRLDSFCAALIGHDWVTNGLFGFKEWLVVKIGTGNNLHWIGLIKLYLKIKNIDDLTEEEHQTAIKELAGLFEEFFKYEKQVGINKIYHDYNQWLLSQSWYTGSLKNNR